MSDDLVRRTLEIVRALDETHEWKQAAEVEAMVRREVPAEIAQLREALQAISVTLEATLAERERCARIVEEETEVITGHAGIIYDENARECLRVHGAFIAAAIRGGKP